MMLKQQFWAGRASMVGRNDRNGMEQVKRTLRRDFEATIEERAARYAEVRHQFLLPAHHFSTASTECIKLYRDGYFLSTVMLTQAVAEGILKLVLKRNLINLKECESREEGVTRLAGKGLVTRCCSASFTRISKSFRNDVHHMNPPVAKVDFRFLAKRNITDLAMIEREIFACYLDAEGRTVLKNPQYWDIEPEGLTAAYLRREP